MDWRIYLWNIWMGKYVSEIKYDRHVFCHLFWREEWKRSTDLSFNERGERLHLFEIGGWRNMKLVISMLSSYSRFTFYSFHFSLCLAFVFRCCCCWLFFFLFFFIFLHRFIPILFIYLIFGWKTFILIGETLFHRL